MALANCRDCGKEVSDEAATCPHCGARDPVPRSGSIVGMVITVVFGLLVVSTCSRSVSPPRPIAPVDPGAGAAGACKEFLERGGYRSADWGEWSAWTRTDNGDGTWSVGARFMGAAPGGSVRNLYVTCVLRKDGDSWTLLQLSRLL